MADIRVLTLKFNGREVTAAPLTSGQISVFQMTTGKETDEQNQRSAHRMMRILEGAVGADQWEDIKDDMADGSVSLEDFRDLTADLIRASVAYQDRPAVSAAVQKQMDSSVVRPVTTDDQELAEAQATLNALMAKRGKLESGE